MENRIISRELGICLFNQGFSITEVLLNFKVLNKITEQNQINERHIITPKKNRIVYITDLELKKLKKKNPWMLII